MCVSLSIIKILQFNAQGILLVIAMSVFVIVMTTARVNVVAMATWQHGHMAYISTFTTFTTSFNIIQHVDYYNMNIATTQAAVLDMNITLEGEVRNADAGMDHSLRFKYMV